MAPLKPMLATLAPAPLTDRRLAYEPKYDGIRAIVEITPRRTGPDVRLWSRNGNDKTSQFPGIVAALQVAAAKLSQPVVLDGEIVALDERGRPAGFQRLQGRIHLTATADVVRQDRAQPAALVLFDVLRDGDTDLCRLPLTERRTRLEALFGRLVDRRAKDAAIRISEQVRGDARAMHERARAEHWEGLIAKDLSSTYQPGRRSPAWRKIKLVHEQEFVVAGWTEPRQTRQYFGALLLGVYEGDRLVYVGHTGTGFDQRELARVWKRLKAIETRTSPFAERIKTNEPAHWVTPELVAQIRFTEWTADRKLRHPVYLGLRDDKPARDVVREREPEPEPEPEPEREPEPEPRTPNRTSEPPHPRTPELPAGVGLTNLSKPFWPALKLTKGDLLRYYLEVSPLLLPVVADRPLVMKRFPNGIAGKAFYQQRSRDERVPAGVRIETVDVPRFIGGSLATLVYMTQLAAISQDPWFSRVQSPDEADYVALDLDPTDTASFASVLDVARWVHDELESIGVPAYPKTSGSRGLHIYIPLPPRTSYESGLLFCQIVATLIATRHPRTATIERMVTRRPRGSVYVDYLQNIRGKTLACAYSARASDYAGVSTPLTWDEVHAGIDPRDFTIVTAPARFREVGDLWAGLRTGKPADLEAVFRKYGEG